jgi:hypothetical protein
VRQCRGNHLEPQLAEIGTEHRRPCCRAYPDVEAILRAWHERHVSSHLAQLVAVRDQAGDAGARLAAVLEAYALIAYARHES